ncbi:MAG: glycosyltransferase [Bacteroidia bacterium]|nr:glycosyltransferase [Bacteroidia bacterium]
MPAGAIGAILKFMQPRVKLILDSVEPHAESMAECNIWKRNSLKFRLLFFFEKLQIWKADRLILAEKDMPVYIKNTYHLTISDYFVKPSCVDLEMFSARCIKEPGLLSYLNLEDKVVCVYAGKFGGFYLKDEIFKFIRACQEYWGRNKFRFLLLSNADEAFLKDMTVKYGIEEDAVIKLFVPHAEIPKYIGLADFALSPYKPVPSKRFGTPIKNGEYWAMGLPVVITPDISEDSNIITENNAGVVLNGFTEEDFLHAITQIDKTISHKSRMEVYNAIRPLAEKYRNFSIAEEVYGKLYSGLVTC